MRVGGFLIQFFLIFGLFLSVNLSLVLAVSYDVNIIATVPGCGDALIGSGEECDGTNFGGATCSTIGFSSGVLSCSSVCTRITSACVFSVPSSGGSTILNNNNYPNLPNTNIVVGGVTEPYGRVQLLKEGQLTATAVADEVGRFQMTISGLNEGTYLMQLVAVSSLRVFARGETFPLRVVSGLTTKVSDVLLPPAMLFDETFDSLVIRGRSAPKADITLKIQNSSTTKEQTVTSDEFGDFTMRFLSQELTKGEYEAYTKISLDGMEVSNGPIKFHLSNLANASAVCISNYDLNSDCALNLIDFILARRFYHFTPTVMFFDYNKDGSQDLTDFSIMAYYWTG